jgi:hypothetical protein
MATTSGHIVSTLPVNGWVAVGSAIGESLARAGRQLDDVSVLLELEADDLKRQVGGEPVLSSFELQRLAEALGTTTGVWFYGDRPALFRGEDASGAAAAAAAIGRELMLRHLALEAASG